MGNVGRAALLDSLWTDDQNQYRDIPCFIQYSRCLHYPQCHWERCEIRAFFEKISLMSGCDGSVDSQAVRPTSDGSASLWFAGWRWRWTPGRAWCYPQSHGTPGTDPAGRERATSLRLFPLQRWETYKQRRQSLTVASVYKFGKVFVG